MLFLYNMLHRKVKILLPFPKLVFFSVMLSDLIFCLLYYYKMLKPFQCVKYLRLFITVLREKVMDEFL